MSSQTTKHTKTNKQKDEIEGRRILEDFYRKSTLLLQNARREARTKYPELFNKSSDL